MEIISLIGKIFNLYLLKNKEDIKDESNLLAIKKRALFHENIPDLTTVKNQFGKKYDELKILFEKYDPVKSETLKDNPEKYKFIAKTLIYQLKSKETEEEIANLVNREFKLWFHNKPVYIDKLNSLLFDIYEFKISLK